ncbi:MAG: hypothetical protein WC764_03140 [Candidatus Paceibacterota bacterium]|jgi:hypothetical protein
MSDSNKLVLTAIIGIFIGLIFGRLLWYSKTAEINNEPSSEATSTSEVTKQEASVSESNPVSTQGLNSVSVENQPAGKSVQVTITADQTVWVEVRDNNNGATGKVLGAKHFAAGSSLAVVPLQRATESGSSYFVALVPYSSDTLDYSASAIMKDSSDQPISASFTAE